MSQNLISLSFTPADVAEIDNALGVLEAKLASLIALTVDDRRTLTKMGDRSESFCRQAFVLLAQHPQMIPPSFDLVEAQNDLANIDLLRPRIVRLRRLLERADDSMMALGSDVMNAALEGYGLLKVFGEAQGLSALRSQIAARFTRSARGAAAADPGATAAAAAERSPG